MNDENKVRNSKSETYKKVYQELKIYNILELTEKEENIFVFEVLYNIYIKLV